jgi:hypothetical protein
MRAFEQAIAYEPRVGSAVAAIRDVKGHRLPAWLQFLLFEYGLIELTPYVTNAYTLLDEGRVWQIERDTFAAVVRGLGWVSAPGSIVEAPARRTWWNSFQVYLDSLPPADVPNLERIEKIVGLSAPFRSDFRRGVNGYDVPALEGDYTRLDASILDRESGVRLNGRGPLWSFGKITELSHELKEAEGLALDNWQPRVAEFAYSVDFKTLTAVIDEDQIDIDDAIDFSRSSKKWHYDLTGNWFEFDVDEIAATNAGAMIEEAADRLCEFKPQINRLEDADAATVTLVGVDDPFGGDEAIRVLFEGSAGRVFLVAAEGLETGATYSVSFFARLVSSTGLTAGGGDASLQDFFDQMVAGQWVRIEGQPFTAGEIVGQWLDITLTNPGASMVVDLFGFQIEAGAKITSPIGGDELTGHRAADVLSLILPTGQNNIVANFDDGTSQSYLRVVGPFSIIPEQLNRPLLTQVSNAAATTWASMSFPWTDATFPWASDAKAQRQIALASWFQNRPGYIALRNGSGQVIGYRRTRVVRQVDPDFNGQYVFGGSKYVASPTGRSIFIEAMTDAGNGGGSEAKSVDIVFGGQLAPGVKPGRLWLAPDELTGGVHIAAQTINIPLRATVRERLKLLLRF